jgi:hypothetical protein
MFLLFWENIKLPLKPARRPSFFSFNSWRAIHSCGFVVQGWKSRVQFRGWKMDLILFRWQTLSFWENIKLPLKPARRPSFFSFNSWRAIDSCGFVVQGCKSRVQFRGWKMDLILFRWHFLFQTLLRGFVVKVNSLVGILHIGCHYSHQCKWWCQAHFSNIKWTSSGICFVSTLFFFFVRLSTFIQSSKLHICDR